MCVVLCVCSVRDISKVFQGILMIKPLSCAVPETMAKLWIHECQRCFQDRLINDEDRLWFSRKVTLLVNKQFGIPWTHEEMFEREPIQFGDFYRPGMEKTYEENTKVRLQQKRTTQSRVRWPSLTRLLLFVFCLFIGWQAHRGSARRLPRRNE